MNQTGQHPAGRGGQGRGVNAAIRVAAALACAGLAAVAAGCGGPSSAAASPGQRAAARFLAAYARPNGQVPG